MSVSVRLPELGESITEGTVTRWLKKVGDAIAVDEPLVEVATDKVDTEIPSPIAGVLLEICAQEDDIVDVGGVLARIESSDGTSDEDNDAAASTPASASPSASSSVSAAASSSVSPAASASAPSRPAADVAEQSVSVPSSEASSSGGHLYEVVLPELGESISEGTVTRWFKSLGEHVDVDEELVGIATDKVDTSIPSPVSGTLAQICAREDDQVPVGQVIAVIEVGVKLPGLPQGRPDFSGIAGAEPFSSQSEPDDAAFLTADNEVDVPAGHHETAPEQSSFEREPNAENTASDGNDVTTPEEVSQATEENASAKEGEQLSQTPHDPAHNPAHNPARGGLDHSYVTPLVRKLAQEHGVDLASVSGSGLGGRIVKKDILEAAAELRAQQAREATERERARRESANSGLLTRSNRDVPAGGTVEQASVVRQAAARAARYAARYTAAVSQMCEVDLTDLLARLGLSAEDENGTELPLRICLAYVVARCLADHPQLNSSYRASTNEVTYHHQVDLSFGMDTPQGLLSPVLHDAQKYSLADIAKRLQSLTERAQEGTLTPDDILGGTFSVASPTTSGLVWETPLVIPPQAAALCMGTPQQRAVVHREEGDSSIAIRSISYLVLSFDTAVVDAPNAARFLADLKHHLENADFLDGEDLSFVD